MQEVLNAGTETSAITTQWAMSELILNPHIIKQAQEELDAVVGVDRLVQDSDIPKLPYLQAIVKETFRLHPPAPFPVPRESTQPSQIMGYNLPAQTTLIFNLYAIHRDPDVYENPDMFNPDRFMKHPEVDHTSMYDYYQLMPFGAGRRMCPGYQLGDMLVHLMVANLLHNFDWGLPKGENVESFDMSEVMSLLVSRKNPLYLVANPRLLDAHLE
jgi:cytochrome P450